MILYKGKIIFLLRSLERIDMEIIKQTKGSFVV